MKVEVVVDERALTGESPLWSAGEGALYWIDTWRERIERLHVATGKRDGWTVPAKIAAVGLRARGGLIVAMRDGIAFLDTDTGAIDHRIDPEPDKPQNRLNDGKVDRAGRFWFGSMEETATRAVGKLYRFGPGDAVAVLDDGYVLPNGPAWSPDDRLMYLADTRNECIYVYDFDSAAGTVGNRRVFAVVPKSTGRPDGATVDADGCLWSARPDGWSVVRYTPAGAVDRVVEVPVSRPTSVAFGGADLRTLYITTASSRLEPSALAAQPHAGAILAVRTDIGGLPEPLFID